MTASSQTVAGPHLPRPDRWQGNRARLRGKEKGRLEMFWGISMASSGAQERDREIC